MRQYNLIPDVNYHLTSKCNMSCKFCFAKFLNVSELGKKQSISLVKLLAEHGYQKINFVGGEPTLCPWLKELVQEAKNSGMITSIVTNGLLINKSWLNNHSEHLDWIGVSIDSVIPETNRKLGRYASNSMSPGLSTYLEALETAKEFGLKIKINTVVTRINKGENFTELISQIKPEKWKIFQVLLIRGENDKARSLTINNEEFENFLLNHRELTFYTKILPEYSEDMIGSYLMIDPSGCFFDNSYSVYVRSDNILKVGIADALKQVKISKTKFTTRHDPTRIYKILS